MNFDSRGVPTVCSAQATSVLHNAGGEAVSYRSGLSRHNGRTEGTGCSTISCQGAGYDLSTYTILDLGLRENFDMKQNMVTYIDQDTQSLV